MKSKESIMQSIYYLQDKIEDLSMDINDNETKITFIDYLNKLEAFKDLASYKKTKEVLTINAIQEEDEHDEWEEMLGNTFSTLLLRALEAYKKLVGRENAPRLLIKKIEMENKGYKEQIDNLKYEIKLLRIDLGLGK